MRKACGGWNFPNLRKQDRRLVMKNNYLQKQKMKKQT